MSPPRGHSWPLFLPPFFRLDFLTVFDLILECFWAPKQSQTASGPPKEGRRVQVASHASVFNHFWRVSGPPDPHESMRIAYYCQHSYFSKKYEKRSKKYPEMVPKSFRNPPKGVPRATLERCQKHHVTFIDFHSILRPQLGVPGTPFCGPGPPPS